MNGFKITDPIDNAVRKEYFNLRLGRGGLALIYKGVQYMRYPERLFRLLNRTNMEFGLTDDGYWFCKYPKDCGFVLESDPTHYAHFVARLTESRWEF